VLARVESLFVFPVKACAGLAVGQLVFDQAGRVDGDREWVVTDAAGQVTWQGDHPLLARVQPALDGAALVLHAPGQAPLHLPPQGAMRAAEIGIWNDVDKRSETFAGWDAGPAASAFLHAATGADLRLVRLGAAAVARASVNPVHLLSLASLDELNQALRACGHAAVGPARFRPNIVLDGEQLLPFLEEQLTGLHWDDGGELRATTACVRCVVPNVDPATGQVQPEPGPTVAELSTRRRPGAPSTLGVYARPTRAAVLACGAVVRLELSL